MKIKDTFYKAFGGTMSRQKNQIRKVKFTTNFTKYAQGSVLIETEDTKVICTASVEEKVPPFLKNTGNGWISAEYSMLPSATKQRKIRDSVKGKIDGRSQEIQRLIGRAIRNVVDLTKLGERTIWIDCDVIQADGGTRTSSINGAFVAVALALKHLYDKGIIKEYPVKSFVGAISAGIVNGERTLDLNYFQDSSADVDMNIVMNDIGEFIEIQGTGEKNPFSMNDLNAFLSLCKSGIDEIILLQKKTLGEEITNLIENNKPKKTFLIGTANSHKLEEIQAILDKFDIVAKSLSDFNLQDDDVEETGTTFEENALIKARHYCKASGVPTICDDSGIMVDALDGAPGIYSKRFTNEEPRDKKNNEKMLKLLMGKTSDERMAQFICTLALVYPDGYEHTFTGISKGKIGFEEKGSNGFGYDPLFIADDEVAKGLTNGQLSPELKNKISHRARALEKLNEFLKNN